MDKYKKIIYGECMFRIEEEFETLEDAKSSSPGSKAVYKVLYKEARLKLGLEISSS